MRIKSPGTLAFALGLLLAGLARADEDRCTRVDAPIVTMLYLDGCQSPVGLCTRGTVGGGPLEGTTDFRVLTLVPGPTPDTLVYTGVLTITTRSGSVTIHDRGILDNATGRFFEFDPIVSGTGKYRKAAGLFTSQGFATGTGFIGTLTGALCNREKDRSEKHGEKDKSENNQGEKDSK